MQVGSRVGAIQSGTEKEVYFFGYGVYEGDEVPPPGVGLLGVDLNKEGVKNPKIRLDNGDVVWGCQCWWGSEEKIKAMLAQRMVILVSVPE